MRGVSFDALCGTLLLLAPWVSPPAQACSRAVYFGKEGRTLTGRTMDWPEDMRTNLWIFPRGMARQGDQNPQAFRWTSRYGSVIATAYDLATTDGMNEKGLVANMLYLAESRYPSEDARPALAVSALPQYLLDQFATVAEAVAELRKEPFRAASGVAPNGAPAALHFSISDASGDSAILEYLKGKLVIHHGRQYQVMTNSPIYPKQLAASARWKQRGTLPGTDHPTDRFVRAAYYINATQQSADGPQAVASVLSVMRNVSVPRGLSTPEHPHCSTTLWRTVADQKQKVYYFEDTAALGLLWVDLSKVNFEPGSGARILPLHGHPDRIGDQTNQFKPAAPFPFLPSDPTSER